MTDDPRKPKAGDPLNPDVATPSDHAREADPSTPTTAGAGNAANASESSTPDPQRAESAPPPVSAETSSSEPTRRKSTQQERAQRGAWAWLARLGAKLGAVAAAVVVLLLLVGVAQRNGWLGGGGDDAATSPVHAGHDHGEEKRYICPMMCTPPASEPGRCPVCGMPLVEATGGGGGDGISVTIDPAARRLVGIQTAVSKLQHVERTIRTVGSIDFDESRLATISAYTDGRLEKMVVDYVGAEVNEGHDLALIYSPQLYSAQTEYITSLESQTASRLNLAGGELRAMAREKLIELGMTGEQIDALKESRKPQSRIRIKSPQSGTVIAKPAVEGAYVKTGDILYRIADLGAVWLMLDLYPDDAATVRFGQQVEAEIDSAPGEIFTGRVAFIDPTVDKKSRTVRVRVEMQNFDGKLRPGDYATARITTPAIAVDEVYDPALAGKYISPMHPQIIRDEPGDCPLCGMDLIPTQELGYATAPTEEHRVVTVPRSAVLLGGDSGVIYVETEPGRFEIRRVTVGPMTDDDAIIVEGLSAGETVATDGNFLIDSQMQLAGNPSLLDPSKATTHPPGPLKLPDRTPVLLTGEAAEAMDAAYVAYFDIQEAMAADTSPPPVALNRLIESLRQLEMLAEVPDAAQQQLAAARRAARRMDGSLETARDAYRAVSHAMLRAATYARGPATGESLTHYYCPMVPGGGGDWMQPGGELANPYWGAEMLGCGEIVRDMAAAQSESLRPAAGSMEAE